MSTSELTTAPVHLTREGQIFRLVSAWNPTITDRLRTLPYAAWDGESRSWTCEVCDVSVEELKRMYVEQLVAVWAEDLFEPGEAIPVLKPAILRAGSTKRPFVVHTARRDDALFATLRSLPGYSWNQTSKACTYPAHAAAALSELAERGILADPQQLLQRAGVTVTFDGRRGRFKVLGGPPQAQPQFDRHFPTQDPMALWRERGVEVSFLDDFSAEVYAGEIARRGDGIRPASMTMDLYPYQAQDVAYVVARTGSAILHQPGIGKTAIAVGAGAELLDREAVSRVVFVCPSSIRTQVGREIVRFTRWTDDDVVVIGGDKQKREAAYARAKTAPWLVVHYDILQRDKEFLKGLCAESFMVFDEAHKLKSPKAARTKAAKLLVGRSARRVAMTGTPVENDPGEWFSVMGQIAVPMSLGSATEFCNRYQYPGRFGGFEGARNLPELRERSRYHYSRRLKADVAAHLPPLRVQQVVLDPDPAYASALRRVHRDAAKEIAAERVEVAKKRAELSKASSVSIEEAMAEAAMGAEMTAVSMLRALCSSPRLLAMSESDAAKTLDAAGLTIDADGPKLDELRSLMAELRYARDQRIERATGPATPQDVTGERVVVFTYSRRMADLISERLQTDGITHRLFTGSTSQADRDAAVLAFTDPSSDVTALICTDAAAEGLNLGTCCNLLVNFDVPWSPSILIQRGNRIHRVDGTAPSYLVLNYIIAGTMEAGVLRMLERKADLADAILGEHGGRAATTGRRKAFDVRAMLAEAFQDAKDHNERDADGRAAA